MSLYRGKEEEEEVKHPFTAQPLGVVLVAAHGVPPGQTPEDGRVRCHEVDVHP